MNRTKHFYEATKFALGHFWRVGALYRAAALSFVAVLSTVPLLIVSFSFFTLSPFFHDFAEKVQEYIGDHFVPASAKSIHHTFQYFVHHHGTVSEFNVLALFAVAFFTIFNVNQAFNVIWRISRARRVLWKSLLLYLWLMVLMPVLIGGALFLSSFIIRVILVDPMHLTLATQFVLYVVPYLLGIIAFTYLNWALPDCVVKWRHAFIAGMATTVMFEVAKFGFALYVKYFATYQNIYGALATVPIFMLWLYVSWVVILLGALIASMLAYE